MQIERQADAVVIWAPAKVNLFLEILAKRPDGYHEIATLMAAVSLYDTLEFKEEASAEIRLRCDHTNLSTGPDNLVHRAALMLQDRAGCRRGANIRLAKRIPLAAGLAGGSSDAAATLAGLNLLWGLNLPAVELVEMAAGIGSDVAFFLANTTPFCLPHREGGKETQEGGGNGLAAWCTGRGERVAPMALGQPFHLVLICPKAGLATTDVYRGVRIPDQPLSGEEIRQAALHGNVEEVGRRLHNRLQPVAESLCPAVARLRLALEALNPAGHLMSGSGTSLFALCRGPGEALRIARQLRHGSMEGAEVFVVRSCI